MVVYMRFYYRFPSRDLFFLCLWEPAILYVTFPSPKFYLMISVEWRRYFLVLLIYKCEIYLVDSLP